MDNLVIYIESLVFAADQPITRNDVKYALENCFETEISPEAIDSAVEQLIEKYSAETFAIEVNEIGGGLQFMTKPAFHHVIGSHLKLITKRRLSRVALETLAIIAYKQPVTKTELEKVRGVSCDYAIQKLLEKELVMIEGRADGPGRPLMYSTSPKFMDYLGLRDIKDLPKLRELEQTENSIGESAPIEVNEEIDRADTDMIESDSSETDAMSFDTEAVDNAEKGNLVTGDADAENGGTNADDGTNMQDVPVIGQADTSESESRVAENGQTPEQVLPEMQPSDNEVVSDIETEGMMPEQGKADTEGVTDDSEE